MASDDLLEQAVTFSSTRVFPAVALFSLAAHLILVFFSGIRRREAYGVRRFFLWLAYQVNNWAPTYILGNLYFDTAPREKLLYAFWVPFLLLHLARPDNMSAYSMEDNALSGRVMLFVPLQSFGAITIVYRYIHIDTTAGTLRPASWIMLSLAIFKYVESVAALRRGDLDSIRSTFKQQKTSRETGHGGVDEELVEGEKGRLLLVAHDLFDICKGAFTDYSVSMDIGERRRVEVFGWEDMRTVVEMELSLMYDMLYTKAAMVHTWGGYSIRVVSPFLTAVALSLFWFRYRDQVVHSRDVYISYILMGTTLALDVAWLLRAIGSTWAHAFFKGTRWLWVKHAVICKCRGRWKRIRRLVVSLDTSRLSVSGCELDVKGPSSYRAWSGIIGQHNLLRDFRDTERGCSKLAKSIRLEESWNEHRYSGPGRGLDFSRDHVLVRDRLFERIWSLVLIPAPKPKEADEVWRPASMPIPQPGHVMRRKLDLALGFDPEIEEVILIWHIATGVFLCCAHEDCPAEEWSTETEELIRATEEVIRAVSNYMLFLIAVRPGMIPGLKFRSMYEGTRSALNALWVDDRRTGRTAEVDEKKLARILRDKVDTLPEVDILSGGTRCALMMLRQIDTAGSISPPKIPESELKILKKLNGLRPELFCEELGMPAMWLGMPAMVNLIFDVWVRLLIYASIRCSRDSHAKQLSQGSELTTIIWILTQHTGTFPKRRGD